MCPGCVRLRPATCLHSVHGRPTRARLADPRRRPTRPHVHTSWRVSLFFLSLSFLAFLRSVPVFLLFAVIFTLHSLLISPPSLFVIMLFFFLSSPFPLVFSCRCQHVKRKRANDHSRRFASGPPALSARMSTGSRSLRSPSRTFAAQPANSYVSNPRPTFSTVLYVTYAAASRAITIITTVSSSHWGQGTM